MLLGEDFCNRISHLLYTADTKKGKYCFFQQVLYNAIIPKTEAGDTVSNVAKEALEFHQEDFLVQISPDKTLMGTQLSRWHEAIEIKYVISGCLTVLVDTEVLHAHEGDIVFINPHEVHSNILTGEKSSYHLLMLGVDFFAKAGAMHTDLRWLFVEKGCRIRNLIHNAQVGTLLCQIVENYNKQDIYSNTAIVGLLQALFAVLFRDEQMPRIDRSDYTERIRHYMTVEPAVMRLRDCYHEQFAGEDLAALCGLEKCYFCRVFKKATGMTPNQYQTECRLRMADILLRQHTGSVSDVGRAVGFEDGAYFSRVYKKHRGVTPKEAKSKLSK